ncbi:MAG: hypothetical protein WBA87_06430 [Microbacterium sp.]
MAEKQIPVTEAAAPSALPSLQLLDADATAGFCTDGYCVLPSPEKASTGD